MGVDQVARDLLRLHHRLAGRGERVLLARLRRELAELLDGMAQEIGLLARRFHPQALRLQGLARPLQDLARLGDGQGLRLEPAEAVEDGAVLGRVGQGAVVMLAVNLDDRRADHPQDLHRDRLIVDEGAGAPVGILHAAQDEIAVGVDFLGLGQAARGVVERQVEHGADLPLRLAMAHERAVAAPAERQRETVEQDRLARAGLAGEHAETFAKAQLEPVDQDDVTDGELRQHGRSARPRQPAGSPAPGDGRAWTDDRCVAAGPDACGIGRRAPPGSRPLRPDQNNAHGEDRPSPRQKRLIPMMPPTVREKPWKARLI